MRNQLTHEGGYLQCNLAIREYIQPTVSIFMRHVVRSGSPARPPSDERTAVGGLPLRPNLKGSVFDWLYEYRRGTLMDRQLTRGVWVSRMQRFHDTTTTIKTTTLRKCFWGFSHRVSLSSCDVFFSRPRRMRTMVHLLDN
jgi:hypothetical protein